MKGRRVRAPGCHICSLTSGQKLKQPRVDQPIKRPFAIKPKRHCNSHGKRQGAPNQLTRRTDFKLTGKQRKRNLLPNPIHPQVIEGFQTYCIGSHWIDGTRRIQGVHSSTYVQSISLNCPSPPHATCSSRNEIIRFRVSHHSASFTHLKLSHSVSRPMSCSSG